MKKVVIFGTCQASVIADMLKYSPDFVKEYNIYLHPPAHLISLEESYKLHDDLKTSDLFITQSIIGTVIILKYFYLEMKIINIFLKNLIMLLYLRVL